MKKIIYGILAILLVIVVGFIFLSVYKGSESSGNQKPKTGNHSKCKIFGKGQ